MNLSECDGGVLSLRLPAFGLRFSPLQHTGETPAHGIQPNRTVAAVVGGSSLGVLGWGCDGYLGLSLALSCPKPCCCSPAMPRAGSCCNCASDKATTCPCPGSSQEGDFRQNPGKGGHLLGQVPPSSVDIRDVPGELGGGPDDKQSQELLLCTRLLSYTRKVHLSNKIDLKGSSLQEFLCKSFPAKTQHELSQTRSEIVFTLSSPGSSSHSHPNFPQ